MDQIYALDGAFDELISHTLSYDHLVNYNNYVCKDLGLLIENRTVNLTNSEDEFDNSEVIVVDVAASEECFDQQCSHINFLQGPVYDGSITYQNLDYIVNYLLAS